MTSSPHYSTFMTRLKIVCARVYARRRKATPTPGTPANAGLSVSSFYGPVSGPSAPGGHIVDTPTVRGAGAGGTAEQAVCPASPARSSCVVVQDAAVEAARSSSTPLTTRAAGEQATTQALPLCRHGYYAARCPHCQEDAV
jgi:hypothetical protein